MPLSFAFWCVWSRAVRRTFASTMSVCSSLVTDFYRYPIRFNCSLHGPSLLLAFAVSARRRCHGIALQGKLLLIELGLSIFPCSTGSKCFDFRVSLRMKRAAWNASEIVLVFDTTSCHVGICYLILRIWSDETYLMQYLVKIIDIEILLEIPSTRTEMVI